MEIHLNCNSIVLLMRCYRLFVKINVAFTGLQGPKSAVLNSPPPPGKIWDFISKISPAPPPSPWSRRSLHSTLRFRDLCLAEVGFSYILFHLKVETNLEFRGILNKLGFWIQPEKLFPDVTKTGFENWTKIIFLFWNWTPKKILFRKILL